MDLYQDGTKKEFTVVHLFAGIGGAALGFQQAREEYKGLVGRFRTLVGIDVDPEACADFEALTGAPAVEMDLFARSDYEAFHGSKPPDDWREATAEDILAATGGECPDVVFLSPPCKGFSGLLPNKKAVTPKYQALNNLVIRGLKLTLEAFSGDLPACIMNHGGGCYIRGRGTGHTFAYCIKLVLSQGEPLDMRKPEKFSDNKNKNYARTYFRRMLYYDVWLPLKEAGIPVRKMIGIN